MAKIFDISDRIKDVVNDLQSPMTADASSGTEVKPIFEYISVASCTRILLNRGKSSVIYRLRVKLFAVSTSGVMNNEPSSEFVVTKRASYRDSSKN